MLSPVLGYSVFSLSQNKPWGLWSDGSVWFRVPLGLFSGGPGPRHPPSPGLLAILSHYPTRVPITPSIYRLRLIMTLGTLWIFCLSHCWQGWSSTIRGGAFFSVFILPCGHIRTFDRGHRFMFNRCRLWSIFRFRLLFHFTPIYRRVPGLLIVNM